MYFFIRDRKLINSPKIFSIYKQLGIRFSLARSRNDGSHVQTPVNSFLYQNFLHRQVCGQDTFNVQQSKDIYSPLCNPWSNMPPKCYGAYSSSVALNTFPIILVNNKVTFKPSLLSLFWSHQKRKWVTMKKKTP